MILLFALFWFFLSNQHFGWNPWPWSDAELLADGIFLLLLAMHLVARKVRRPASRTPTSSTAGGYQTRSGEKQPTRPPATRSKPEPPKLRRRREGELY